MKKILTAVLIVIVSQLNVSAGTKCQTRINEIKNSIEIKSLKNDNLCLVTFSLSADCNVKIRITDLSSNKENYLVNDEMLRGEYNIYYKAHVKIINRGYDCNIEIYNSKMEIIYSKEITFNI